MKRWSVLLLLALLPFTMAPRTSLTPSDSPLHVALVVARTTVDPGTPVRVAIHARNTTRATMDKVAIAITVGWTGKTNELSVTDVPANCDLDRDDLDPRVHLLYCPVTALRAGQMATLSFTLLPTGHGELDLYASGVEPEVRPEQTQTIIVGTGTATTGGR